MKIRKNTKNYVRVIIGTAERSFKGIKKPIKSIALEDTTVKEVFDKIMRMFDEDEN